MRRTGWFVGALALAWLVWPASGLAALPQQGGAVSPPLPAGLALDPVTGVVSGTPTATETAMHTVSLSDLTGTISAGLSVSIRTPSLPPAFGARTFVTLKLARKQIPARGPLAVL